MRSHAPDAAGPALRADGATFRTRPSRAHRLLLVRVCGPPCTRTGTTAGRAVQTFPRSLGRDDQAGRGEDIVPPRPAGYVLVGGSGRRGTFRGPALSARAAQAPEPTKPPGTS
ncbi:hypothetical protein GPZ77_01430 [Streptomyces sp. QHH-9511]|nr:hypothetical protein GPZ77_01430 [Streptomyces sp. QHH-9511]